MLKMLQKQPASGRRLAPRRNRSPIARRSQLASAPSAGGADDLFYDADLHRLYLISGAGEVDTYQGYAAKALHPLGVTHTAPGAKTALFVPSQKLLYVGVPGAGNGAAEIRVYSTGTR